MAEEEFVTRNELAAIIQRLDARISSVNRNITEMRADIRRLSGRIFTLYALLIPAIGVAFTLYKLFPNR